MKRSWRSLAAVIAIMALITGGLLHASMNTMRNTVFAAQPRYATAAAEDNAGSGAEKANTETLPAEAVQAVYTEGGDGAAGAADPAAPAGEETVAEEEAGAAAEPGSRADSADPAVSETEPGDMTGADGENSYGHAGAGAVPNAAPRLALQEGGAVPIRSLLGCAVFMDAPDVKAGDDLYAEAVISGIYGRAVCQADWYYDGAPMDGYTGEYVLTEDGTTVSAKAKIEYSEDMQTEHTIGLMVTYTDPATGHTQRLYNQADVTVHNYSKAYYVRKQNEEAIKNASSSADVSSVYKGNYSSSYNVDYSTEVKTSFINDGGYSSSTGYLVWVNLATQKVNVFEGSKGNWQLIHTWRCATGAPDTPTPKGVTYTTYKQTGWITDEYQVKYVTRFYPGSGYAFHSVLYTPDGSSIQSGAVGYPKSHGCVRTEDEGVRWIYNNLPAHSTVVIY